ncbi:MAG: hypothetical protein HUJ70_10050 [Pseudobutyrivibrio sp.]|nr:hypothetical protein [Pseudobutyrivibrio sp.]
MAEQVTNYKCLACGGSVHFDGVAGKLKCDYCDSTFSVEEMEAAMKAENEKAAAAMAKAEAKAKSNPEEGQTTEGMKLYSCPSCGAELICDETTAATCCPYCGNQTVIPGQFSGRLEPEFVIPFKTEKKQAKEALTNHYKGKVLLPKSFITGNHIEDIQGVYVPFWMFDCLMEGDVEFEATSETVQRKKNKEITTKKYYRADRSGSVNFEKVPVDASVRMPDGHMDSIEPFNYEEMKPFSMAYMPGFLAEKYDVSAKECEGRMQERCETTFVNEAQHTVTGYDSVTYVDGNMRVKKATPHYAMLPVWLLCTKWQEENFIFAMNGQTGKLVGDLPMDKKKYWTIFFGEMLGLMVLMYFLCLLIWGGGATLTTLICGCLVFPIIITWLTLTVLKQQLVSVETQSAARYVGAGGITLSHSEDTYLRTETTTRDLDD